MTDTLVVDTEGQRIVNGSMVLCGDGDPGRVTLITDPGGDMDDEGRMRGIAPSVQVLWPEAESDEDVEEFSCMSSARGPGDYDHLWICDELTIVIPVTHYGPGQPTPTNER